MTKYPECWLMHARLVCAWHHGVPLGRHRHRRRHRRRCSSTSTMRLRHARMILLYIYIYLILTWHRTGYHRREDRATCMIFADSTSNARAKRTGLKFYTCDKFYQIFKHDEIYVNVPFLLQSIDRYCVTLEILRETVILFTILLFLNKYKYDIYQ